MDGGLYERVLAAQGSEELPPRRPPRPSAAVVPWRRDGGRLEVFWVRRSLEVPFMPGWYAFPGGAVGRDDAAVAVAGEPAGLTGGEAGSVVPEALLLEGERLPPDRVPGLLACALRELFEETGILLVRERVTAAHAEAFAVARERLLADPKRFAELVAELEVTLDASPLVFAGRWLTPPFAPVRFDNRFFLLEWPPHRVPQLEVLPGELAAGEWIEPAAALARWQTAEVIAAPPILHLLTVLAEDGPQAGLPRLRDPAEADLGPYRRIEFRPGVILVPVATATLPPATHTNCYLLGGEAAVLVDPGSTLPTEQERLLAALAAARDRLGRRVQAIWLTHHHPDHVGGAEAARQALGVPLLAHPATAERLAPLGLRVDDTLAHEQRLRLGDMPVRVLHTPGHARGHLCFLDERHGSLLCGDMVSALSTIVIDPPEGHMGDYLRSLESLIQSGAQTLFPSHGPVLADAATTLRRYVEHRRWREGRILEAWCSGLREPAELLPQVYEEVPRLVWPLAERQLVAHLEHLREQGEIR